jgi:hypothetical protein
MADMRKAMAQDQRSFSDGYQAALADIKERLAEGGAEAVAQWIANNERT